MVSRVRIFKSPYLDVRYAAGRPLTVQEYLRLKPEQRQDLHELQQG